MSNEVDVGQPSAGLDQSQQLAADQGTQSPSSALETQQPRQSVPVEDRVVPQSRYDAMAGRFGKLNQDYQSLQGKYGSLDQQVKTLTGELQALRKTATPAQRDEIDDQLAELKDDPAAAEVRRLRAQVKEMQEGYTSLHSATQQAETRYWAQTFQTQCRDAVKTTPDVTEQELAATLATLGPDELEDPEIVFRTAEQLQRHYDGKITAAVERRKDQLIKQWGFSTDAAPASVERQAEQQAKKDVNAKPEGRVDAFVAKKTAEPQRHAPRPQAAGGTSSNKPAEPDVRTPEGRVAAWLAKKAATLRG